MRVALVIFSLSVIKIEILFLKADSLEIIEGVFKNLDKEN